MTDPRKNFYNYIMSDVKIPILPNESQTSYMAVLQHEIYDELYASNDIPQSSFASTLKAPMRESADYIGFVNKIHRMTHSQEIPDILQYLHAMGSKALFSVQYDPDLLLPAQNIIYFRINELLIDSDHSEYIHHLYQAFKVPLPKHSLQKTEATITHRKPAREELQSPDLCFHPLSEHQLNRLLMWVKFYTLPNKFDRISLDDIVYFEGIGDAMSSLSMEQWKEYLVFCYLHHISTYFSNTWQLYSKLVFKVDQFDMTQFRTEVACKIWWQDSGKAFIQHNLDNFTYAKQVVEEIAENLRYILAENFKNSNLEPSTVEEALNKLNNLLFIIGWSDYDNTTKFSVHKEQPIYMDEWAIAGHQYQYDLIWSKNGMPSERREWRWESVTTVNAFYSRESNVVYIPSSLFYPPFLTDDLIETYAGIGSIIAHELYHAFDFDSRNMDGNGMIKHWWSAKDEESYLLNARKAIALYSKRNPISGNELSNGRLTLSENIADLMALRITFQALIKQRKISTKEKEKFFARYVVTQAQVYSKTAHEHAKKDVHAFSMARINLPLSCFQPFLYVYQIQRKDAMFTNEKDRPNFIASTSSSASPMNSKRSH